LGAGKRGGESRPKGEILGDRGPGRRIFGKEQVVEKGFIVGYPWMTHRWSSWGATGDLGERRGRSPDNKKWARRKNQTGKNGQGGLDGRGAPGGPVISITEKINRKK